MKKLLTLLLLAITFTTTKAQETPPDPCYIIAAEPEGEGYVIPQASAITAIMEEYTSDVFFECEITNIHLDFTGNFPLLVWDGTRVSDNQGFHLAISMVPGPNGTIRFPEPGELPHYTIYICFTLSCCDEACKVYAHSLGPMCLCYNVNTDNACLNQPKCDGTWLPGPEMYSTLHTALQDGLNQCND